MSQILDGPASAPAASTPVQVKNRNLNHTHRIAFIHNPKAAGTSFRRWLGMRGPTDHRYPTFAISKNVWDSYRLVLVVRHPVSRLLSGFRYHCNDAYQGAYRKKYPDLPLWDLEKYFDVFAMQEVFAMGPQYLYSFNLNSNKSVDFTFKFEELGSARIQEVLGLDEPLPMANVGSSRAALELPTALRRRIEAFYQRDFLLFDYEPAGDKD